ncbi:MAG: hypothetical protein MUC39_03995 [Candidatus Omnitrophica bacterium]|jgi:hypothetical protein|nr:hypothetical protein [Candidatus Omnitrophota bacterium]
MNWKEKISVELKKYWLNVFYISVFFSIFTDYRRLILAHYNISYQNYGVSVIKGLILAKVILVAEHLNLGRGFEDKPLIMPTLNKSFLFTICVAILSVVEHMARGFFKAEGWGNMPDLFIKCFSYEWFAGMFVVFVAFIPFFAFKELDRVLGEGKIRALFFRKRTG